MDKQTDIEKQTDSDQPQASNGLSAKIIVALIVILLIVVTLRRCQSVRDVTPDIIDPSATLLIVPPDLPAAPIPLPSIALPDERVELLGMLRVRDASTFTDRLNAVARRIDPSVDTTSWLADMAKAGIDVARFRPGEHAALFIHKPEAAWNRPWLSGLLPMTAYEFSDQSPLPRHFASFDRYTVFAAEADDLDAVLAQRSVYDEITQQPIDGGLSLTVNLRDIWTHYGPSAKLWFPIGRGMAGVQMLNHPMFIEHPETVETIMDLIGTVGDMVFDALDGAQAMTMDVNLTDQYAHVDLGFAARPETLLARSLTGGPVQAPDLMSLLPTSESTLMITQETVTDWALLQELYRRLMRAATPQAASTWDDDGEPVATSVDEAVDALIDRMAQCGQTTIATRMTVRPDADPAEAVATDYLILSENPDAFVALFVGHLKQSFESGLNAKIYSILGLTATVQVDDVTMDPFDGPVHRIRLVTAPDTDNPGILPPSALDDIAMTVTYEIGRLGPYVLATSQTAISDLAQAVLKAAPTGRHSLFRTFEPGTAGVGRFHPAAMTGLFAENLPPQLQETLDTQTLDDTTLPPIEFAIYRQDGHSVSRIRIPLRILTTLRALSNSTQKTMHAIDFEIPVD